MTPEEVNELIKTCHEAAKARGEWDGLPNEVCSHCRSGNEYTACSCDAIPEKRNTYMASKLDLITETTVLAMMAHRIGCTSVKEEIEFYEEIDIEPNRSCYFFAAIKPTLESLIALVSIRTADLMGFYEVEYESECFTISGYDDTLSNLREICNAISRASLEISKDRHFGDAILIYTIKHLLRIAELEKIDIKWHIGARLDYMEGK